MTTLIVTVPFFSYNCRHVRLCHAHGRYRLMQKIILVGGRRCMWRLLVAVPTVSSSSWSTGLIWMPRWFINSPPYPPWRTCLIILRFWLNILQLLWASSYLAKSSLLVLLVCLWSITSVVLDKSYFVSVGGGPLEMLSKRICPTSASTLSQESLLSLHLSHEYKQLKSAQAWDFRSFFLHISSLTRP